MKFSIPKEILQQLLALDVDAGFHERALRRIAAEVQARQLVLLQRTGNLNKRIINTDLDKGEIEVANVIVPAKK